MGNPLGHPHLPKPSGIFKSIMSGPLENLRALGLHTELFKVKK